MFGADNTSKIALMFTTCLFNDRWREGEREQGEEGRRESKQGRALSYGLITFRGKFISSSLALYLWRMILIFHS